MSCDGTCSACGDLCADAERAERIVERDLLRSEVEARWASESKLASSLRRLDAEVARLRARETTTAAFVTAVQDCLAVVEAERDHLSAVLADTPENVASTAAFIERWYSKQPPWTEPEKAAAAILADLRARAGL